ncbi:intron Large complex component GCFC2 [Chanos chanos]|uniref:Intron Large complex component GCFC2 n=1 Tax=Chanos chanos TaxID=29144 RepID=A0A6J2W115_CHACN|nr:GC-rich sequence DNA-binding factor 2 [Chanos chanos]
MFNKKTRRNFRQRKDDSSEDDENGKGDRESNGNQATAVIAKPTNFQRRGISCSSKPNETPPHKSESSDAEDAVEDLVAVKSQSSKVTSMSSTLSFSDDKESTKGDDFKVRKCANKAVVFQVRKKEKTLASSIRPQAKKQEVSKTPEESSESAEDVPADSEDDNSSTMSSSSSTSRPQSVTIPDARKIHAAKEQRRRMRGQRDYIPLDGDRESTPEMGEEEEMDNEERDSDNEPDDHERRIEFAPKSKTLRERMAETMGESDSEQSQSDSEEKEGQSLWEEQQIGKGFKRHHVKFFNLLLKQRQKKVDIPKSLPPISTEVIKRRIIGKLESLREVHRAREAELRRIQFEIESSKESLEGLENGSADEQLRFYRSMNVFTHNLVECLSEKMALINSVELDMHTLYFDQTEALLSQRRTAVREESARLQKLSYNTDSCSNGDAVEVSKPTTDSLAGSSEEDWGRVPADMEPTPEQEAELQNKRADILKRSRDIFADVQEDFFNVKKILSRFNEWRVSFPDSYNNAYISLCLPKLLSPLIRHQLIGWNPLKVEGEDFEALPWYSAVETFCHGQGFEESEKMDRKTLPGIIEKAILPKVQGFVEFVWDPLSWQQSQCLASLCKRLQDDYSIFSGELSKTAKAFMEAVTLRLRSAVDDDVFIPLYPKKFLEDRTSPQFKFQNQQFWSAVKLLSIFALWDGLVPDHVLKELALDKLLNRYLMMTLLNESSLPHSVHKCRKVAVCFPRSWFEQVDTQTSLPQLKNFSSHLVQTAQAICKADPDPGSRRELLSGLLSVLRSIKAEESINVITEQHQCKDLLDSLSVS